MVTGGFDVQTKRYLSDNWILSIRTQGQQWKQIASLPKGNSQNVVMITNVYFSYVWYDHRK